MIPILLVLLCAVPVAAQAPARKKAPATTHAPASNQDAWPLLSLKITGNQLYTEKQVIQVTGLKIGQSTGDPQFLTARDRLMKTGAFESISYQFASDPSGKGINGTIAVVEVDTVYPFRFEELPATDAELRAFLKKREPLFEGKLPATKEYLTQTAAEIQKFVAAKGFKDSVIGKVVAEGAGELTIIFRPAKGPPSIGVVTFTGNDVLSVATLNNAFGLVAIGVPYTEKKVRDLLDTGIRPLYEEHGRLRVAFPAIDVKPMKDVDGVAVTVSVAEGPAFKFGEIKTIGSALTPRELTKAANLKSGEPANFAEVTAAVDRIQKILRTQGFMRSQTHMERRIHDKELTVDVDLKTVDGPRFEMGKLTIDGLDVTTEPAIRKLWSMTPGKPFNAEYPQVFLDRVKEDGYLENLGRTMFTQQVNEEARTVDVALYFKGAPPDLQQRKKKHGPEF